MLKSIVLWSRDSAMASKSTQPKLGTRKCSRALKVTTPPIEWLLVYNNYGASTTHPMRIKARKSLLVPLVPLVNIFFQNGVVEMHVPQLSKFL